MSDTMMRLLFYTSPALVALPLLIVWGVRAVREFKRSWNWFWCKREARQ